MTDTYRPRNTVNIAVLVALGGFLFGFDASVISGVVTYIVPEFSLNELEVGLVVAAPTLAAMAAGLMAGPIADFIGRKKVLLILAALYTISALGSAFAPNYPTLVVARGIGGFAFASLVIAPMYIAEIAPHERRGFLVSFNQFNIMIGFSAAYFANYFVLRLSQSGAGWTEMLGMDRYAWRWMLGLEILPAMIWLAGLLFIPETPRWLALNGGIERARKVLAGIRPRERVETTLRNILESGGDAGRSLLTRLGEVLSPKLRLPIVIGITSVFNSGSSSVVQFVFPWELAYLGNALTFYIFAALGILGLLLINSLLPETKGKSLEELEVLLAR